MKYLVRFLLILGVVSSPLSVLFSQSAYMGPQRYESHGTIDPNSVDWLNLSTFITFDELNSDCFITSNTLNRMEVYYKKMMDLFVGDKIKQRECSTVLGLISKRRYMLDRDSIFYSSIVQSSEKPLHLDVRFVNDLDGWGFTNKDLAFFRNRLAKVRNLSQSYGKIPTLGDPVLISNYISPYLQFFMLKYSCTLAGWLQEMLDAGEYSFEYEQYYNETIIESMDCIYGLAIGNSYYDLDLSKQILIRGNPIDSPEIPQMLYQFGYTKEDVQNYETNVITIQFVANYLLHRIYGKPMDGFEYVITQFAAILDTIAEIVSEFEYNFPNQGISRTKALNFKEYPYSKEYFMGNRIFSDFHWE